MPGAHDRSNPQIHAKTQPGTANTQRHKETSRMLTQNILGEM